MKKLIILFIALLLLVLTACSDNENRTNEEKQTTQEKDTTSKSDAAEEEDITQEKNEDTNQQNVDVDKGLLNVEITLPATMFEGQDIESVISDAKKEGVKEVVKNDDGSLTYKMSKQKHKEMLGELEAEVNKSIEETKNSEEYKSIKDITHNDALTEFTVVVDRNAYENSMDGVAILGLGISGAMYQTFAGGVPDSQNVTISIMDETTQEVFDKITYPDDLEHDNEK
ncbi:hypothetical protein [Metabacillus malikii]|uniref:Flagellar biosynthesis component FlhA n=1 Tax=Metabacillus malikii TaxID=1504265 RepID=A0ABT9ZL96_9BACI|nr:hypothetical protein [Metabacillus malikii]MDQ0233039.1 flagellar biosynthesis component FlhA [Metabacillus malikii]